MLTELLTLNYFCMSTKINDLKAIADRIRKINGVHCGYTPGVDFVKEVCKSYDLSLPEEFMAWSSEMNGLWSQYVRIYALRNNRYDFYDHWFVTVFGANEDRDCSIRIILGETGDYRGAEREYLVYVPVSERYELQERRCWLTTAIFATLADALVYLFDV